MTITPPRGQRLDQVLAPGVTLLSSYPHGRRSNPHTFAQLLGQLVAEYLDRPAVFQRSTDLRSIEQLRTAAPNTTFFLDVGHHADWPAETLPLVIARPESAALIVVTARRIDVRRRPLPEFVDRVTFLSGPEWSRRRNLTLTDFWPETIPAQPPAHRTPTEGAPKS